MWSSRRGAAMIEAAVVLPLLILSVLTCLFISMFFYDTTQKQCRMHQALRAQAGELTGRTHTLDPVPADEIRLSTGIQGLFETITGKEEITMIDSMMLKTRVSESTEALWHASDGVSFIRYHTISRRMKDAR